VVQSRVAQLHGLASAGEQCPGEDGCEIFQSAYDDPEIGEDGKRIGKAHVCLSCPMLPTKVKGRFAEEEAAFLEEIERIIAARDAGLGLSAADLTPLQYEALLIWTRCEAEQRREHEARVKALFESLLRR
jgi:hypothetical protein